MAACCRQWGSRDGIGRHLSAFIDYDSFISDSAMEPISVSATPIHCRPDSERLLRAHSAWVAAWDGSSDIQDETAFDDLVKLAFSSYCQGLLPIQVRWRLAELHSSLPARVLRRAQRQAERLLLAAESAPPELRRAQVAAARQTAIQGALAAGDWGPALRGLDRAGEIAGELREGAGLAADDLALTVAIEAESVPLPAGDEGLAPVSPTETVETGA